VEPQLDPISPSPTVHQKIATVQEFIQIKVTIFSTEE